MSRVLRPVATSDRWDYVGFDGDPAPLALFSGLCVAGAECTGIHDLISSTHGPDYPGVAVKELELNCLVKRPYNLVYIHFIRFLNINQDPCRLLLKLLQDARVLYGRADLSKTLKSLGILSHQFVGQYGELR